ncbi:glycoside hydrolase family 31 protein, partial [Candidatus Bipolaricaulota bacterium]|nr:glycoside hydrolase family 31 protein [Candidatus Bipolaricaulota bacterium]
RLGLALEVTATEGFYGLMERPAQGILHEFFPPREAGLNLRGQEVWLYVLPTHALYAPFFVSSAGWGLYVESSWPGIWRFGRDGRGRPDPTHVWIEYEGPELLFRIIPGPSPLEVVARYARTTGTTVLPPKWAFGPWRWRDEVWNLPNFFDGSPNPLPFNSMVVEDVLMMEALGIPCSVYILDRPWAEGPLGYGTLAFDPVRFPNAPAMLAWLREKGIHPVLWVGPWVTDPMRQEALSYGYHVRNAIPFLPEASLLDFANPEAVSWWQEKLTPLIELGVAGFKLDRGDEKVPDGFIFRGRYSDGTDYREGHNAYPLWFARAAHGAFARAGVEEFLLLVRAGWAGSSRYAVAWGGDPQASAWGLRESIIALQRAAAINFPIWGADTGGYVGRPTREVLARWLAFSCFTPIMEVGPTANLAPWAWVPDGAPAKVDAWGYHFRPYYEEELLAIWVFYARLHQDLADYLYALAKLAHEEGTPIVRSMALAYPDRPEYRDLWEQYLFGPDILVRPVWRVGEREVTVHIPDGVWVDAWTRREVTGPAAVTVEVPLHVIPIYIRAGSTVDLRDLQVRWADAQARARHRPLLCPIMNMTFGVRG